MVHNNLINRFLRGFFRLLYHQFAWTYDFVAWIVSLGRWRSWVFSVVDYLPPSSGRVLELGHGPGHLLLALRQRGVSVVGMDESRWMSRQAASRLKRREILMQLVNGTAQRLPFEMGVFRQVVTTFPSEYIFSRETLMEVNRVLEPGGSLVVMPFAWITGNHWLERLAAWFFQITGQSPPTKAPEIESILRHPFESCGFSVHTERKKLDTSEVLIIIAKKPK